MKLHTVLPILVLAGGYTLPSWAAEITYPVPEGSRWALLRDSDNAIVREDGTWPRRDGMAYDVPGHTWLQRIVEPPPVVDPLVFELVQKQAVRPAKHELRITYTAKWRDKDAIEASLDQLVTMHAMMCAQGRDVQSACAAAAGIAQQLADGDLSATDSEKRRAKKCGQWVKVCVRPNEANGDALLDALRTAYQTRNDPTPAPVPDLQSGWTDAPATP